MIRRLKSDRMFEEHPPLTQLRPNPMQRVAHTSTDCGTTWSPPFLVDITHIRCHGTLARAAGTRPATTPRG